MSQVSDNTSSFTWIKRSISGGFRNLRRNLFLSVATILVISLMLFVFNLILALNFASDSVIEQVGKKFDIRVEMIEGTENYSIQAFISDVQRQQGVEEVIYISKNEALKNLSERYPSIVSFVNYNDMGNPLPDVVQIVTQDVSFNNQIIQYLEDPQFSQVVNQAELQGNIEQKERNEKILDVTRFIQSASFWLILVFILVGLAIIFNSININIHTNKKEIAIMKLVGAKHWFIRTSFIFEGVFFAISAFFISILFSQLVLVYLGNNLLDVVTNQVILAGIDSIFLNFHFRENLWITFIWQFLMMLPVGFFSSYLAIELYLRRESE